MPLEPLYFVLRKQNKAALTVVGAELLTSAALQEARDKPHPSQYTNTVIKCDDDDKYGDLKDGKMDIPTFFGYPE